MKAILLLVFVLFGNLAISKNDSIDFIAYWALSDSKNYILKRTETKETDSVPSIKEVRYKVNIKVVDSSSVGYYLLWTQSVDMDFLTKKQPKIAEFFKGEKIDFKFKIQTTDVGSFVGIVNWKDVINDLNYQFDNLAKKFVGHEQERVITALIKVIKSLYDTKEKVELACINEIQLFFLNMGYRFPLDVSEKYETEVPNPFGGSGFIGIKELKFEKINSGEIISSSKMSVPDTVMNKYIVEMISKITEKMKGTVLEKDKEKLQKGIDEIKKFKYDFVSREKHIYDENSFWLKSYSWIKNVKVKTGKGTWSGLFVTELNEVR